MCSMYDISHMSCEGCRRPLNVSVFTDTRRYSVLHTRLVLCPGSSSATRACSTPLCLSRSRALSSLAWSPVQVPPAQHAPAALLSVCLALSLSPYSPGPLSRFLQRNTRLQRSSLSVSLSRSLLTRPVLCPGSSSATRACSTPVLYVYYVLYECHMLWMYHIHKTWSSVQVPPAQHAPG
jgi:hypothetical protein